MRGAGFGYLGSTLTSLISASFTFIFFALEGSIMAQAFDIYFGVPLWLGYLLASLIVIPLVVFDPDWAPADDWRYGAFRLTVTRQKLLLPTPDFTAKAEWPIGELGKRDVVDRALRVVDRPCRFAGIRWIQFRLTG